MASQEEIINQQKRLSIYRRNLENLLNQAALFGGMSRTPLSTLNEIREARDSIREIKGVLRSWDVPVEDHALDMEGQPPEGSFSSANTSQTIFQSLLKRNGNIRGLPRTLDMPYPEAIESDFLELAFLLLLSTLFALVLVEALVISGRSVSIFVSAVVTLTTCLIVTITLFAAWKRRKAEIGVGIWSVIAMIALILAPGGPFIVGDKEGVHIINLWIPILALAFLSVTAWIYMLGNPLDKMLGFGKRLRIIVITVTVAVVANISLGQQYKLDIQKDPRTPNVSSAMIRGVLTGISDWNVAQKRKFYAAVAEIRLLYYYSRSQQLVSAESFFNSPTTISSNDRPGRRAQILSFFQDLNYADAKSNELTDEIIDMLSQKNPESEFISFFQNLGFSDKRAELLTLQVFDISHGPSSSSLRDDRLTQIIRNFTFLPREDQQAYLAARLKWIHPVGLPEQDQSTINLPGIKEEQRVEALATQRVRFALANQNNQVKELLKEFNYDPVIVAEFDPESPKAQKYIQYYGPIPILQNQNDDLPSYFEDLGSQSFVPRLREQLSLPVAYESALAFAEYNVVARSILISHLVQQGVPRVRVDEIFKSLDALPPKSRDAFIYYCITNEANNDDNYQALLALKSFDFSSMAHSDDAVSAVPRLVSMIEAGPETDITNPLSDTARLIRNISSESTRQKVVTLLRNQNPTTPVYNLLDKNVFDLVAKIDTTLNATQIKEVFGAIRDPIKPTIAQLIDNGLLPDVDKEKALSMFNMFSQLDNDEQEGFLHQLALSLYKTEGRFAHNIFNLVVLQANLWDESAGLMVASLICSPFVILVTIMGAYAARRLITRDILKELILAEAAKQSRRGFGLGTTDAVRGRENIIVQLRRLAGRGWSSIAVVGRRGVGKTRILYNLMHPDNIGEETSTIKAWVAAPSKFDEAEFVESVLERLTADVEDAIAQRLGAKPLEVRRLEVNTALKSLFVYISTVAILTSIFSLMSSQVANGQVVGTWFPTFVVFVSSIAILLAYISKIQPVNLTPWLERDRSNSPHTVLLYREARQIRDFLDERRKVSLIRASQLQRADYLKIALVVFVVILVVVIIIVAIIIGLTSGRVVSSNTNNSPQPTNTTPYIILVSLLSSILLSILVLIRTGKAKISRGYSLMSLISTYREFVERMVFRIRQGALGTLSTHSFEVIVCIDELDKIVDPNELRDFLRRIKVIFEIPGAYYYLSLSEDALKSLYLGSADGKNEIDSAFDHILYIPPVGCDLGSKIASSYILRHSKVAPAPRVERSIAAISYGVPRDIIRRCDELLISDVIDKVESWKISDDFRKKQAALAYGEQLITRNELVLFSGTAEDSLEEFGRFFDKGVANIKSARVVLSLWTLALISVSSKLSEQKWDELSEKLRSIGYRIPEERIETLIDELRDIQNVITSRSSGVTA